MSIRNFIWVGEVVRYNGMNATVVDIDLPDIILNIGLTDTIVVGFKEIQKIQRSAMICPTINN